MSTNEDKLDKARFFFDVVSKTDDVTASAHERLNKKLYEILGILSAVFPLVFGLGYFILNHEPIPIVFCLFLTSLIVFLIAFVQGLLLLRQKSWFKYVNPLKYISKHKDKDLPFIINKYSATWADTINHNIEVINSHRSGLRNMLILIILGLIVLVVAFGMLGFVLTQSAN